MFSKTALTVILLFCQLSLTKACGCCGGGRGANSEAPTIVIVNGSGGGSGAFGGGGFGANGFAAARSLKPRNSGSNKNSNINANVLRALQSVNSGNRNSNSNVIYANAKPSNSHVQQQQQNVFQQQSAVYEQQLSSNSKRIAQQALDIQLAAEEKARLENELKEAQDIAKKLEQGSEDRIKSMATEAKRRIQEAFDDGYHNAMRKAETNQKIIMNKLPAGDQIIVDLKKLASILVREGAATADNRQYPGQNGYEQYPGPMPQYQQMRPEPQPGAPRAPNPSPPQQTFNSQNQGSPRVPPPLSNYKQRFGGPQSSGNLGQPQSSDSSLQNQKQNYQNYNQKQPQYPRNNYYSQ